MRLGQYITLMPYTVISGFMSGIGVSHHFAAIAPSLGASGIGWGDFHYPKITPIVVIPGQVQQRLENSLTQSPKIHQMENRLDALEAALGILQI